MEQKWRDFSNLHIEEHGTSLMMFRGQGRSLLNESMLSILNHFTQSHLSCASVTLEAGGRWDLSLGNLGICESPGAVRALEWTELH